MSIWALETNRVILQRSLSGLRSSGPAIRYVHPLIILSGRIRKGVDGSLTTLCVVGQQELHGGKGSNLQFPMLRAGRRAYGIYILLRLLSSEVFVVKAQGLPSVMDSPRLSTAAEVSDCHNGNCQYQGDALCDHKVPAIEFDDPASPPPRPFSHMRGNWPVSYDMLLHSQDNPDVLKDVATSA